ncbi:hypothetical protein GDO81_010031 [Engystomops pustulosus]|uniref:Optineurin n=1 Tax=Engystomops pustulosus TaxID=76066 RepID=A0AAV7BWJ3_ENGPU|nr:hypothetical protein GDO81_010031 [Engystomops pustulosus]
MKERLEELLKREKLREEHAQSEPGYTEANQRLLELNNENELLRKEIHQLKEKENLSTETPTCSSVENEEEIKHLKTQIIRLQAEKADLLGIISELQIKLSSCTSEDSFVEIRIAGKDIAAEENTLSEAETKNGIISYRAGCSDDEKHAMESEELAVSKLLHSLREETEKVEELQKELANANERLSQLERKSLELSDKETETEPVEDQGHKKEFAERLTLEVDNLKQKIEALNKELYETGEKLNEAQLIKNNLQDRCSSLDKKLVENQVDLEERQELLYSVQKLELQVESLLSEMKMERSKAEEQQQLMFILEETVNKQKIDYESLKQADIEIYCADFHAEREARQNIHQEKEQIAARLAYILQENEKLKEERGRESIEQLQRRHSSIRSADGSENSTLASRGTENFEQPSLTVHTCPKCQLMVPDMDTLQIHVMDCIT